jgi:hypothetical protein
MTGASSSGSYSESRNGSLRPRVVACSSDGAAAREQPAREGAPGNDRDPLVEALRDHLPLLLAVDQVVVVLHRDERRLRDELRLRELPRVHAAGADVARLAGLDHVVERVHRLVDRRRVVPAVDLVEVDVVEPEPLQ